MKKLWLLSEEEIEKHREDIEGCDGEVFYYPPALCRAQHLKTIRWLKSQGMLMGSLKLSLDDLFAQARKDVEDE